MLDNKFGFNSGKVFNICVSSTLYISYSKPVWGLKLLTSGEKKRLSDKLGSSLNHCSLLNPKE